MNAATPAGENTEHSAHPTSAASLHAGSPAGPQLPQASLLARLGAEFVGTFLLVLVIAGGGLYLGIASNSDALTVPVAAGAAFAAAAAAFGYISGGHFNPAITLGQAIAGNLRWSDLLPYWVSQILGALAAAGTTYMLIPGNLANAMGQPSNSALFSTLANGYGDFSPLGSGAARQQVTITPEIWQAFVVEIIASALLVGVFIIAHRRMGRSSAAVKGATLAVLMMVTFPFTNSGLNPARATGIAFLAEPWALQQLWLFWVAPLLGATIAGLVVSILSSPEAPHTGELPADQPEFTTPLASEPALDQAQIPQDQAQTPQDQAQTPQAPSAAPGTDSDGFEVRDYTK